MALLGSAISGEVGLRLLLSPLGTNVVIRTACCTVGIALPVYNTFKAIEKKDPVQQKKWLVYWAAFGTFSLVEIFSDRILSWCPMYYHIKFAFLVWLQLPSVDGAKILYERHIRPFLLRHQARLDKVADGTYRELAKFANSHQGEIQFARSVVMKILASANQMIWGILHPTSPIQGQKAVGGSPAAPASATENGHKAVGDTPAAPASSTENHDSAESRG
ncbi:hypothetical protein MKW98_025443 [Papaver atlanticum]|uniref:HVA22-like protein n=1 Tax=Papaver atlanticum TaxID=357466 RepID=A0AAD4XCS2_9MAGN|nr:hypothetical protein MKW98_025443 [Papaver atlanticum]